MRELAVALCLALLPGAARAGVLVLAQPGVPQHAEALAGFHELRPEPAIDPANTDAVRAALARGADVVVAIGARAFDVARAQARGVPIVAAAVLAPEARDARVAAVPLEPRARDAVAALAALAPGARHVAVLHPPGARAVVEDARAAAKAAGVQVSFRALEALDGFPDAFRRATEGADAVWVLTDPRLARPQLVKAMVASCLERRIPLVGFVDGMTRIGALLSVSADFRAIGREAARLATDVGARPGDPPPLRFVQGRISMNERVRDVLGLPARPLPGADVYR